MIRSSLCDYSDAYIIVKGNITVNNIAAQGAANHTNKKVIFKNCAQFTNYICKIKNTKVDNAKYIDIVMPMHNLIEYSNNYSKTLGGLWQYCKDIPAVINNGDIVDFNGDNTTDLFNFKTKIIVQTDNNGRTDNVEIMVPLKYLINFWRTLEMPLGNCDVNIILIWSANCVNIIYTNVGNQIPTFTIFTITEANLYVPVVNLSTQDQTKLLQQLKSGFKKTFTWNKYLLKPELLAQNPNLSHLLEPCFEGVNRLFVLGFENDEQRTSSGRYYLPNVKIKNYNVMIDRKSFFDQSVKNNKVMYGNIRKIATGQGDDYTLLVCQIILTLKIITK